MVEKLLVVLLLLGAARHAFADHLIPTVEDLPCSFGLVGPAGSGASFLLRMPDVQKELSITEAQHKNLNDTRRTRSLERRTLFENIISGKVFEEPVDENLLRELLDEYNRQTDVIITDEVLTSTQKRRLGQLLLQIQGVRAFQQEQVAQTMKFSATQREMLSDIQKAQDLTAARISLGEANRRGLRMLSADQRVRWRTMQGEPFPFTQLCLQLQRSPHIGGRGLMESASSPLTLSQSELQDAVSSPRGFSRVAVNPRMDP